jgi:hypothetical protein
MPATTTKPITFERNGKTFELQNPDDEPTFKQLGAIARMLHRNPDAKAPKFPRTKAEASQLISKLKSA